MARFRLSAAAKADLASILHTSEAVHGVQAKRRYQALLSTALRRIAAEPDGVSTVDRSDLLPGLRSFHIRHSRGDTDDEPVGDPVHVIFFRTISDVRIEIVRVLHDRMEPSRHVGPVSPRLR